MDYARAEVIAGLPMSRSIQFASLPAPRASRYTQPRALRLALAASMLASAGWLAPAQAQEQAQQQSTIQPSAEQVPAAASPNDPASTPLSTAPDAPASGSNSTAPSFGQDRPQPTNPARDSRGRFRPASSSGDDSYQPPAGFYNPNGVEGISIGLTPAAGITPGIVAGRQFSAGFAPFSGAGLSGRPGNIAPPFSAGDGPMRGAGGGSLNPFGVAPATLPSLNQLMRGSFVMPLSSSPNAFRFSYQDALRPNGSLSDLGRPSGSIVFTSSDLGNGVFFSAGTGYGSRSTAGAPPAAFGTSPPGAKHSGPALNLKLSF